MAEKPDGTVLRVDARPGWGTMQTALGLTALATWALHPSYGAHLLPRGLRGPCRRRVEEKPKVACGLPGCGIMTTHNGGYCCAEHCREHRRLQKEGRKKHVENQTGTDVSGTAAGGSGCGDEHRVPPDGL